jgi:hypothetical protein
MVDGLPTSGDADCIVVSSPSEEPCFSLTPAGDRNHNRNLLESVGIQPTPGAVIIAKMLSPFYCTHIGIHVERRRLN